MADPVTLALFTAAATSVAGGVMGYQGAQYEASVAEQNAVAAKREGSVLASIEEARGRETVGHARALAAASGLAVDGSASGVIGALASVGDFNARSAIYNGRRRVQQAEADRKAAKMRGTASLIQGVGQAATILTSWRPSGGASPTTDTNAGGPLSAGRPRTSGLRGALG